MIIPITVMALQLTREKTVGVVTRRMRGMGRDRPQESSLGPFFPHPLPLEACLQTLRLTSGVRFRGKSVLRASGESHRGTDPGQL